MDEEEEGEREFGVWYTAEKTSSPWEVLVIKSTIHWEGKTKMSDTYPYHRIHSRIELDTYQESN